MSKELYEKVLEDAFGKMEKALAEEFRSNKFNWDLLIEMIIIEESPLAILFGPKIVQLANLYSTAKQLATVAGDIENYVEPLPLPNAEQMLLPDTLPAKDIAQTDEEWDKFEDL